MGSNLPKYYEKTLDNGLKIIVIEANKGSNVISTQVFYRVGSRNEILGKTGIAHMLEHMSFKSTKNLKAGEFDKIVKSYGGTNNASTGFDYTKYYINSSSNHLEDNLKLFAELMANLNLEDKEFQSERDVVYEERLWRVDNNPIGYLYFRLFNNAFIYHPYHWTPIGFKQDIKSWTIDDIREFYKKYYAPNNAIVVVAGDINKDKVFSLVEKYFKDIKPSKIEQIIKKEPKQDGKKDITIYKNTQVEMFILAYKIPPFNNDDIIYLDILGKLLSGSKSARLDSLLVIKKSLVNTIYAYPMENIDNSLFLIYGICNKDIRAKDVIELINKEIEKLKNDISDEELNRIKISVKRDFIFGLQKASTIASVYGSYFIKGDIKPLLEYEDKINNISKEKLFEVAKKYFNEKNLTQIILKDEK